MCRQVNTNRIQPWAAKSWESLFFSFCDERKYNFRPLYKTRLKKKIEYQKWERDGKGSRYFYLLRGDPFLLKQLLGFSPAGKRNKILKAQHVTGKSNNQYHILTLAETLALTTSKHAACLLTALCWPALLFLQGRRQGNFQCQSALPRDSASSPAPTGVTWILDKIRDRWKYQHMLRNHMAHCGTMPPGRGKVPWAGPLMR